MVARHTFRIGSSVNHRQRLGRDNADLTHLFLSSARKLNDACKSMCCSSACSEEQVEAKRLQEENECAG